MAARHEAGQLLSKFESQCLSKKLSSARSPMSQNFLARASYSIASSSHFEIQHEPHWSRTLISNAFRDNPARSSCAKTSSFIRTLYTTSSRTYVGSASPKPVSTLDSAPPRSSARRINPAAPRSRDRGPKSAEDTQTDFAALNMLGTTPQPTTAIDTCTSEGFVLDSGLTIDGGDGVALVGAEAFVWRPWFPDITKAKPRDKMSRLLDDVGALQIPATSLGLFALLHPKPDLLVVGTGSSIRPLSRETRRLLQEELGLRLEVLDTRNAAAQFNLLATERGVTEVAALILPISF